MDSAWAGVVVTGAIQVVAVVYIMGRFSAKFEHFEKWMDQEAKPDLEDHTKRITVLETKVR